LLPGQFVRIALHGATRPNAILIPQLAALTGQKGKFVYVVSAAGTAEERPIQTADWEQDQFLVSAGLKPGDRVIVSGLARIKPETPVKVVEEQPERAATPEPTPR
jgi:membrane fusion protein (multidrug efflux system)